MAPVSPAASALPATRTVQAERHAEWLIALGALMVACGGLLLGVQVDANRGFSGTGYAAFALGAVIALASLLMVPASSWALRSRARYGVLTASG